MEWPREQLRAQLSDRASSTQPIPVISPLILRSLYKETIHCGLQVQSGFVSDEFLLPARQTCERVPVDQPLRRPGVGKQLSAADCGFMPLARPEPYLSHQLMLLTDVIVALNKTLAPTARMPVMLWAVRVAVESVCINYIGCLLRISSRAPRRC